MSKQNKVIELECMIRGKSISFKNGKRIEEPCKRVRTQMKEILEDNPHYNFVDLVYHPTKTINMEYASLIVTIED